MFNRNWLEMLRIIWKLNLTGIVNKWLIVLSAQLTMDVFQKKIDDSMIHSPTQPRVKLIKNWTKKCKDFMLLILG